MSLKLIVMRHAKSSWDDLSLPDHDRPLNSRGRTSAKAIGRWLRERGHLPDQVLCSSATRTRDTYGGLGLALAPEILPELYHASEDRMLQLLRQKAKAPCVLILCHNPGAAFFAQAILAKPPTDDSFAQFPTAATAVIEVAFESWKDLRFGQGTLADFTVPRALLE